MSATATDVIASRARWCVVEGDSTEALAALPAACVNAVITDPPSGISFMGAEWDHHKGGRAQWVAWLAAILAASRVACVDGARLVSWAMPRTSHWTGCAIEDAGWIIETKGVHLFGTGWPKGKSQLKPAAEDWWFARTGASLPLNIDACRVGTDNTRRENRAPMGYAGNEPSANGYTTGSSEGRYPPNTLLTHSIECERVGVRKVASSSRFEGGAPRVGNVYGGDNRERPAAGYADPDGTETVDDWRCVEGCPVRALGEQSGERTSGVKSGGGYGCEGTFSGLRADGTACCGDTGTAARFFPQFQHTPEEVPFLYCSKPSSAEKRAGLSGDDPRHPTVKPIDLMRWLIRLVTRAGDVVLDPFGGSGTTGVAALAEGRRVILVERDPRFAEIARARLQHAAPTRERLATMATAPVRVETPDFGPLFGGSR